MRIFKRSALASLLGLCSFASFATVMPSPQVHQITLPDGSSMDVRLKGTKEFHWYESSGGHALIQQDSKWHFAQLNQTSDKLVSAGEIFSSTAIPPTVSIIEPATAFKMQVKAQKAAVPQSDNLSTMQSNYAESMPQKVQRNQAANGIVEQSLLVVQVSFADVAITHDFTDLVFSTTQQSVKDYFRKNSSDNYEVVPANEIDGTVNDGVIDIALAQDHPSCINQCWDAFAPVFEEIYSKLDPLVNFADFDKDLDGKITPSELSVMFVFAGYDRTGGPENPAIWPHKWNHSPITVDKVQINSYCLFADYQGDHQSTLGVIVHELGHLMLALPDLYPDKNNPDKGSIGYWGVMSGGSWAMKPGDQYPGQTPSNMLAWTKKAAGFVEPRVLNSSGQQEIQTTNDSAVIYVDPYLKEKGSRVYLENRQAQDYDAGIPGEGLLVTSVNINNEARKVGPMQVQILQADGLDELGAGWRADNGDVFPGSTNKRSLSDTTTPSLSSFVGINSDIAFTSISSNSNRASFDLRMVDEPNKYAWATSFQRAYLQLSYTGVNYAAFAINPRDSLSVLDGLHIYTRSTGIQNTQYKLWLFPYQPADNVLSVTPEEGQLLSQGYIPESNRIMLENSVSLPDGKSTLLLELTDGFVEIERKFFETYINYSEVESWWSSDALFKDNHQLFAMNPMFQFSFGALLRSDTSSVLTAKNDTIVLDEDTSVDSNLRNNDIVDFSHPIEGIEIVTPPAHGRAYTQSTVANYIPNTNFHGNDSFTYRLKTTEGLTSNIATVDITVNPVNDVPTAVISARSAIISAGQSITISGTESSDVETSNLKYLWSTSEDYLLFGEHSSQLTVRIPHLSESKRLDVTLTVTDEAGAQSTDTVTFNIQASNKVPVTQDDAVTVTFGDKVVIKPLDNDTDADADTLSLMITSLPKRGSTSIKGNEITYTASGTSGAAQWVETFTYKASDGKGGAATGEITVTVQPKVTITTTPPSTSSSGGSVSLFGMLALLVMGASRTVRTRRKD
ncbi:M6 family metalloprotease domain-containing protein [Vibrio penaeicida]|uniref:M6 family metalloprotease domain-containing protein n=1 Tax=Vibrio penaeicida TaxID=104609 RepID=UPI002733103D|nr:M6 family metalloprotease domain-containing protein [Vibrio penaeicida]MDP2572694.1 M6 family metalloprotease domain-containing protein [Vibrio penaeicida]